MRIVARVQRFSAGMCYISFRRDDAMMNQRLDGRMAVVTGASKGLGKQMAEALAEAGATVALVARSGELLEGVRAEITARGGKAYAFVGDVSVESDVASLAGEMRRQAGVPDILINNAGINIRKLLHEYTLEEWRRVMSTNVDGPFLCTRAFVPGMIEKKFGRIINVASTMAHVSLPQRAAYSGSKFAVLGMTKALALELAPFNITANAISPGPFATEINRVLMQDPVQLAEFTAKIPLGRWGKVEEIGALAVFLSSDASAFITGTDIVIDGGWTAQ
ncbi:MAG TPA: SDR family NAD(P)-dependent oxidoreductase [Terriglobia bacterium]|nr:SDR family NAD(P)-dependent oxidoreductase [Terriglobia bacterium]